MYSVMFYLTYKYIRLKWVRFSVIVSYNKIKSDLQDSNNTFVCY